MLTINTHGVELSIAGCVEQIAGDPITYVFFSFFFLLSFIVSFLSYAMY